MHDAEPAVPGPDLAPSLPDMGIKGFYSWHISIKWTFPWNISHKMTAADCLIVFYGDICQQSLVAERLTNCESAACFPAQPRINALQFRVPWKGKGDRWAFVGTFGGLSMRFLRVLSGDLGMFFHTYIIHALHFLPLMPPGIGFCSGAGLFFCLQTASTLNFRSIDFFSS